MELAELIGKAGELARRWRNLYFWPVQPLTKLQFDEMESYRREHLKLWHELKKRDWK